MQTYQDPQNPPKKTGKKIAVLLSEGIDPEISMELLSVIYEDSDIEPISFEESAPQDEALIATHDPMASLVISVKSEIICPMLPMFDSEIFVLNYQKFYEE